MNTMSMDFIGDAWILSSPLLYKYINCKYFRELQEDKDRTLYIYCGMVAGVFVLGALRSFIYFSMTSLSSRNLHRKIFTVLLRAPISFFDKNPVGKYRLSTNYAMK